MQLLEQAEANTQESLERSGKAASRGVLGIGSKGSSNREINKALDNADWERISEILQKTIDSADDIWNLSAEELLKLANEAPDLYAEIKDLASKGYADAGKYMDEYIEYARKRAELEEQYKESLTNISFDNFVGEFKNALTDMSISARDFATSFNQMLADAISDNLLNNKFRERLNVLYEDFAKYMQDNELSETEIKDLQARRDALYNEMKAEREMLYQAGLLTSSNAQQGSSKGFEAMSQDTGSELNGRFTTMVELQSLQLDKVRSLAIDTATISQNITEMRNLSLLSIGYLESIAKSNNELYSVKESLLKIKENTSRL